MGHSLQYLTSGILHLSDKYSLRQGFIAVGQQIRRGKPQCSAASFASRDASGKMNASALHLRLAQNTQGPQRPFLPPCEAKQGLRAVKNRANLARPGANRMLNRLPMGEIDQLAFVQLDGS